MNKRVWTDAEVAAWELRHTDADHPGTRAMCEHCQLMVSTFGQMPPVAVIEAYRKHTKAGGRA